MRELVLAAAAVQPDQRLRANNATLSSAPEPAAWALMLAGFSLPGGALRRRRAVKVAAVFA